MDFSFGMGDEKLCLMATGRVLGEDESSLFGFVVKQTIYKLTQRGDFVSSVTVLQG